MVDRGSITAWLEPLVAGDEDAVRVIWDRYRSQLLAIARQKLGDFPQRVADEEDALQSAFNSFVTRARQDQFDRFQDRNDLWQLLVVITARKAVNQRQRWLRAKRGGGMVRGESIVVAPGKEDGLFAEMVQEELTPALAAEVAEQLESLLGLLPQPELRGIALLKLEGQTNQEIAKLCDCSLSAVERKLRLIRSQLSEYVEAKPE